MKREARKVGLTKSRDALFLHHRADSDRSKLIGPRPKSRNIENQKKKKKQKPDKNGMLWLWLLLLLSNYHGGRVAPEAKNVNATKQLRVFPFFVFLLRFFYRLGSAHKNEVSDSVRARPR